MATFDRTALLTGNYNCQKIVYSSKRIKMDTIIIQPKDKAELKLFVELAERLGAKFKTLDEFQDEQLLNRMLENLDTAVIGKENVIDKLNTILNEDQPPYKNED